MGPWLGKVIPRLNNQHGDLTDKLNMTQIMIRAEVFQREKVLPVRSTLALGCRPLAMADAADSREWLIVIELARLGVTFYHSLDDEDDDNVESE